MERFFLIKKNEITFLRLIWSKSDVDFILESLTQENIKSNYVILFKKINNNTHGKINRRYFREQFYIKFGDLLLPHHRISMNMLFQEPTNPDLVKNQFKKKKKKFKKSNNKKSFRNLMENLDVKVIRGNGVSKIYKSNKIIGKPTHNLPRS